MQGWELVSVAPGQRPEEEAPGFIRHFWFFFKRPKR
jgi:hypothetical protein